MQHGQRQNLVQQQRLNLSPLLVQSIKMMAMPFADLREHILEEVEKNPALEVISDPLNSNIATPLYESSFGHLSSSYSSDDESDEHQNFIEGALSRSQTLQEHLLEQLGELDVSQSVNEASQIVIQNLNSDGFHSVDPCELPEIKSKQILDKALKLVRSLEPNGCATMDFHESLVVQASLLRNQYANAQTDELLELTILLLRDHFELLEKGRPDALVKAVAKKGLEHLRIDIEEAEGVFEIIRMLDPFPGRQFSSSPSSYIVPDVLIKKNDDDYSVIINEEEIPVLGISPFFMKIDEGEKKDSKNRDFAHESIMEARWFLNTLQRRNHTILRVARALVVYQRNFFNHGPTRIAPLRMKDVAEELGLNESTISRTVNGKYLQCEWGLFEFRHFFSNQVGGSDSVSSSGLFSKEGVKELVKKIIEESKETLSDQKISDILAVRGITVARRTVSKYRNELTIKSSFERS